MSENVREDAGNEVVDQENAQQESPAEEVKAGEPEEVPEVAQQEIEAANADEQGESDGAVEPGGVVAHPVEFGEINRMQNDISENQNVDMLLDVELTVTVELGRKNMLIADILKLGKGSVIELPKAAGEALDVYINGTQLAKGEVVVVEDSFAIRITELANTKERINSLAV